MSADDVEESELWNIAFFVDFHVKLVNGGVEETVIDMAVEREKKHMPLDWLRSKELWEKPIKSLFQQLASF